MPSTGRRNRGICLGEADSGHGRLERFTIACWTRTVYDLSRRSGVTPIPLHAHNPGPMTGDGNWTWLITGRVNTLIDAGAGTPAHLDALEQALGGAPLAQVLVTHAHVDHIGGSAAVAERFPGVRFRKMAWPGRDQKWPVGWDPIVAGEIVAAGDSTLVAVHTPGHAPDHLCFWHHDTRALFCG